MGVDTEVVALQNIKNCVGISLQDMMTKFCLWWVSYFVIGETIWKSSIYLI